MSERCIRGIGTRGGESAGWRRQAGEDECGGVRVANRSRTRAAGTRAEIRSARRTGVGKPTHRAIAPGAGMQVAETAGILVSSVQRSIEVSLPVVNDGRGIAEDILPDVEGE